MTAGGRREDRKTDWWGGCVDKEDGLRKWKQMEWYERGQIDWALKLRQTDWKNDRGGQTLNRTQTEGGMDRLMERRKDNLRLRVKRNIWAWSEMHAMLKGFWMCVCVMSYCNLHRWDPNNNQILCSAGLNYAKLCLLLRWDDKIQWKVWTPMLKLPKKRNKKIIFWILILMP